MSLFGKLFGGSNPEKDLACSGCGHLWSAAPDDDGLFHGYGCPPCPICGEPVRLLWPSVAAVRQRRTRFWMCSQMPRMR